MDKQVSTYFKAQQWAFLRFQAAHLDPDIARWLMIHISQLDQTHLLMAAREAMPIVTWQAYQAAVAKVLAGNPPQYVLGQADFYGLRLQVNPAVLIPRVETEELVDWVLADHANSPLTVLDLGTGSGAIALALKAARPTWQVSASDISTAALAVAASNARTLDININLVQSDLFKEFQNQRFDLIISNPPYIDHAEESVMDESVIAHEPHLALFAANHGLAVYEQLAHNYQQYLRPDGSLYLEIGYHQGMPVKTLFQKNDSHRQVTLKQDVAGHDRMIRIH